MAWWSAPKDVVVVKKEAWGSNPPSYIGDAVQNLRPEDEQHHVDPMAHCVNPKCGYYFTPEDDQAIREAHGWFTCPKCGYETDYWDIGERAMPGGFAPGGMTRSTLTLDDMGFIGEQVIQGMGVLPGIGKIVPIDSAIKTSAANYPIDAVVEGNDGTTYGVEIKTNHSEAQPRFKIGGKAARSAKINYCYHHGLAPALVGVRLNFFDDLADIFFRPGMTDTWIGNKNMIHVGQVNFAHLNPFKTPDQKEQLHNVGMPDQSNESDAVAQRPATEPEDWGVYGSWHVTADDEPEGDPDYIFIYYMSQLKIEPWHHNRSHTDMFDELLAEHGTNIQGFANEFQSAEVATGIVYKERDGIRVEQEGFIKPEVDLMSRLAIREWLNEDDTTKSEDAAE